VERTYWFIFELGMGHSARVVSPVTGCSLSGFFDFPWRCDKVPQEKLIRPPFCKEA
jgi:hypothetical protein